MASISSEQLATSPSKSEKRHKKDKSEKKRAREEDAAVDTERKHKKSKSTPNLEAQPSSSFHEEKKKKKKDKKRKEESEDAAAEANGAERVKEKKHKKKHRDVEASPAAEDARESPEVEKKKGKKKKSGDSAAEPAGDGERKKKKKSKKQPTEEEDDQVSAAAAEDAMDFDEPVVTASPKKSKKSKSHVYQPTDIPSNPQFPFFTQTVSLYEPLFPIGWSQPVTSAQNQHLKHLQNRYVPSLRGVLLDYRNVSFGEQPGRPGAATEDDSPAMVISKAESAVGFGWVTADVDLFVPSRGAWMEGSVNIQTEGHIGLVCFGKFNASIEARRLPREWKWIPNESNDASIFDEAASLVTADEHGVVRQVHSTGYWADKDGVKVKGKIRFRIRNFDVGVSGDTSYLSLEGTMLDRDAERALVQEEAQVVKLRREKKGGRGGHRHERKRIPDFALTKFHVEEDEKPNGQDVEEAREILRQPDDDEVPAANEEEE